MNRCTACKVAGEDRGGEPELHRVRPRDRLVERRVPVERRHGAEDLLAGERRGLGDVLEDRGGDQVALVVRARAARGTVPPSERACSIAPMTSVEGRLGDERPDLGLRVGGVADLAGCDPREQLVAEGVVDVVLDEDAARRGALLPGRPERAGVGRLDRAVELGVGGTMNGLWPPSSSWTRQLRARRPSRTARRRPSR